MRLASALRPVASNTEDGAEFGVGDARVRELVFFEVAVAD
jgi:hypothetical protein